MKRFVFVLVGLFVGFVAKSATPEDSVKMVINSLFTGMKNSNANQIIATFSDSAILQTIGVSKAGKVSVKSENIAAFAKQVSEIPIGDADERITFETVKVDGDLAIAWTPYKFYYKGKFSHCGVNSFQLVRINGSWKIQYIIDTRRKDNCNE